MGDLKKAWKKVDHALGISHTAKKVSEEVSRAYDDIEDETKRVVSHSIEESLRIGKHILSVPAKLLAPKPPAPTILGGAAPTVAPTAKALTSSTEEESNIRRKKMLARLFAERGGKSILTSVLGQAGEKPTQLGTG